MNDQKSDRGAALQFEISRDWWNKLHISQTVAYSAESALQRLYVIAQSAACDVIRNGGTLVIVASKDKITMVQRPDTEDL